ncbi:hypothetical protein [Aliarcobacter butzleri]|uniref:hypothetical protein n=1 Tax=Aliarcobacter butzleri TaxID=28197 RepID=UPI0012610735|nr:hypothetical protein [Aliarcobacter butzleri]MCG3683513.1 hypothetical protein [Aliarcobacter butzleri]
MVDRYYRNYGYVFWVLVDATIQQENVYFVSWVEADGLGANVVLNLKDKKVNAFLIIPLSGTVTIIK